MKLANWFEPKERESGEKFVTLMDDAPEWLTDAVRDAHAGDLPNDWVYAEARAACDAIDEGTLSNDDEVHEHADGRVDVYTRSLFIWAAEMCGTTIWANAEEDAGEVGSNTDRCEERIKVIQLFAIRSIACSMLRAVAAQGDEGVEV